MEKNIFCYPLKWMKKIIHMYSKKEKENLLSSKMDGSHLA